MLAAVAALALALSAPAAVHEVGHPSPMQRPRSLVESLLVPMAPTVHYVQGVAPGGSEQTISTGVAYAPDTDTVYSQGLLPKFARGHENGHALDDQILTDGDRRAFTRVMGLTGAWDQGTGLTAGGLRSPSEFFADWYGNAAIGNDPSRAWDAGYAQAPDPKAFRHFRQMLDRVGHRKGLLAYQP